MTEDIHLATNPFLSLSLSLVFFFLLVAAKISLFYSNRELKAVLTTVGISKNTWNQLSYPGTGKGKPYI